MRGRTETRGAFASESLKAHFVRGVTQIIILVWDTPNKCHLECRALFEDVFDLGRGEETFLTEILQLGEHLPTRFQFIHFQHPRCKTHLLLLKLDPLHGCDCYRAEQVETVLSGPGGVREKKGIGVGGFVGGFPPLHTQRQIMPTRAHRPTPVRTHSRSSSGGSSKVVLNLQLTQKDPVLPKIDKARRTSHPVEVRHSFPSITTPLYIRTTLVVSLTSSRLSFPSYFGTLFLMFNFFFCSHPHGRMSCEPGAPCACNHASTFPVSLLAAPRRIHRHPGAAESPKRVLLSRRLPWGAMTRTSGSRARAAQRRP